MTEENMVSKKCNVCVGVNVANNIYRTTFMGGVSSNNNYSDYDGTECSETSAHKIQSPGNHPK
jgi:hypothetical protein